MGFLQSGRLLLAGGRHALKLVGLEVLGVWMQPGRPAVLARRFLSFGVPGSVGTAVCTVRRGLTCRAFRSVGRANREARATGGRKDFRLAVGDACARLIELEIVLFNDSL